MAAPNRSVRDAARVLIVFLFALATGACDFWKTKTTSFPGNAPPAAGSPGIAIDASGGTGTAGNGGTSDPEEMGIYLENNGPGGVQILRDGTADASVPADVRSLAADLGTEPLIVATDTVIPVYPDHPAENGVCYFLPGDSTLYRKVDDTPVAATGIRVEEGATLTVGLNNWGTSQLYLPNDIEILGTLRTAFPDLDPLDPGYLKDRGGLNLQTGGAVFVRATGTVSAAGESSDDGRGGNGGSIDIRPTGIFLSEGAIVASGGTTTGADRGGSGGNITIGSSNDGSYSSGPILATGGSGALNGGNGGYVRLYVDWARALLNSGDIDARGGDCTGTDGTETGNGGYGGAISLYGYGGTLITSGNLTASGGNTSNGNSSSYGGAGGYIDIELYQSEEGPAGTMEISGNLSTKGGNGPNGGDGAYVYCYYGDSGGTGGLILRGYSDLIANGGDGAAWGGGSGYIYLYDYCYDTSAGGIVVEANLRANGGSNLTDAGCGGSRGGYVDLWTGSGAVRIDGTIQAAGGAGVFSAGGGGNVWLYSSSNGVTANRTISADGGDSAMTEAGSGASAGSGGNVSLWSGAPPSAYGSITVDPGSGGDPDYPAGAGTITIDGGGIL